MWCGTDYDNEKSRSCSSYFNMLYEVRRLSGGRGVGSGEGEERALRAWRGFADGRTCSAAGLLQCRGQPHTGTHLEPSRAALLACPQYVKIGIADPTIHWIDLGASRRSAKTAIGFTGYPVRCGARGGAKRGAGWVGACLGC